MTYSFPAIVAVLSIFFAHAPAGPRPWIALAIATTGVVLSAEEMVVPNFVKRRRRCIG